MKGSVKYFFRPRGAVNRGSFGNHCSGTNMPTLLFRSHSKRPPTPKRTYLLTPWCRVLLEKLTGLQPVKKFPAFYGTRRFITALTSVRHLGQPNPVHIPTSHLLEIHPNIIPQTYRISKSAVGYFGLDSVILDPCLRPGSSFDYNYRWVRDYRVARWNPHRLSTILGKTQ